MLIKNIEKVPALMRLFKTKKNRKIGLALGGGAVLGAAHIGVLKAMDEMNIPVHYIAGTSIGAFIAVLYAFGKKWEEIEKLSRDLKWLDLTRLSVPKLGLLSNKKLGDVIKKNIGDVNIEESEIPLAVIAADIITGEKIVFKKGDAEAAVMASTCIPGIFIPVEIAGRLLVDGGIVENVPVSPLKEMGANYVISVDLNAKHTHEKPDNIVEILLKSYNITLKSATELQTAKTNIKITPDLSGFNMVDMGQGDELVKTGYMEAKKALTKF